MKVVEIDAYDIRYKELNSLLKEQMMSGADKIILRNVSGQKFIGTRLYVPEAENKKKLDIEIFGTPGNDLGAFLHGHRIIVHANAQDGIGNTMEYGEIVVHGRAGDVVGMAMRGGKVFVRDSVGYRAAMHMKEYQDKMPVLVVGGTAQDFLGEYMAGGVVILLGLDEEGLAHPRHGANFIGTGMHGGAIYLRGKVEPHQLGKEVGIQELDEKDREVLEKYVEEFVDLFGNELEVGAEEILMSEFVKLAPVSKRPYGTLYAH